MSVRVRGVSKRERIALKHYINDIYSINGAVFLEVSDKKKVRKALDKRAFDYILSRSYNLLVLPYHEGVRFNIVYNEYIHEFINPDFKPILWDELNSIIDINDFKLFTLTMIIRNGVKFFTLPDKSLMYMVSMLMGKIGINTTINLGHNQVKLYTNLTPSQIINLQDYEISKKHYIKYGWLFKMYKMKKESLLYYEQMSYDDYIIPIFPSFKYSKHDNYVTSRDNYISIIDEFKGAQWLSKRIKHEKSDINQVVMNSAVNTQEYHSFISVHQ